MCGRYVNAARRAQVEKEFKTIVGKDAADKPRYNIAPAQMIDTVVSLDGERTLDQKKWGLIPSWAKDVEIARNLINARAETITEKPSFRDAFKKRRCIIPASGFYEWKKAKGGNQPYYFYLNDKELFGFAGLWEEWLDKESGELLETCTIITTSANEALKPVHHRMPVILKAADYDEWLDDKVMDSERLQKLLTPYPAQEMAAHPVSTDVNTPAADSSELIIPLNSL